MVIDNRKKAETSAGISESLQAVDSWIAELARLHFDRASDHLVQRRHSDELAEVNRTLRTILSRLDTIESRQHILIDKAIKRTVNSVGLGYLRWTLRSRRAKKDVEKLANSDLFDIPFYCQQVPGLPADLAIAHYFSFGSALRLDPHPLFSTGFYLSRYADVRRDGINPLLHFITKGYKENRQPHPLFDSGYYTSTNKDVRDADINPLVHFLTHGWKENRDPSPEFWINGYLEYNKDLAAAGVNPLVHFALLGRAEGRFVPVVPRKDDVGLVQKATKRNLKATPKISVIVPMYNTEPHWAIACIESILNQSYENFELILIDDASPRDLTRSLMRSFADRDPRIKLVYGEANKGISGATNAGLAVASGELVAFVDHDDVLRVNALDECAYTFEADPDCDLVYSDHALENEIGEVIHRVSKPVWSPVMFLGVMYLAHLVVIRRSCLDKVGGLDPAFDGVQDFELELRLSRVASSVKRIATPLYGWRAVPGSIAAGADNKAAAAPRQLQAVQRHLSALGLEARVAVNAFNDHRLTLEPVEDRDRAADILFVVDDSAGPPDDGLVASLRERTTHADGLVLLSAVAPPNGRPNFDALYRLIAGHGAEFVAFVRSDAAPSPANWLSRLDLHLRLPSVGMVSPMLVCGGRVASAGRAYLTDGTITDLYAGENPDSDGHIGMLSCAREVSLPSPGVCLLRRADLVQCGPLETWGDLQSALDHVALELAVGGRSVVHVPSCRFTISQTHPDGPGVRGRSLRHLLDVALMDEWTGRVPSGDPYWPS